MSTNANLSTTNHWLTEAIKKLKQANLATARLDCLVLLEDALQKDRSWLLAHPETVLQEKSLKQLNKQITRRAGHEPLAYIRGKTEFYGREFFVNTHTLEPRPETETMIDAVKTLVKSRENLVIADIGTGSGCIAVSVKLEIPSSKMFAVDIDELCVKTARENAKKLNADVTFFKGSLLEPFLNSNYQLSIIAANLPYVPDDYHINEAAQFEPRHAIFGGTDGLDLYRELFKQTESLPHKPGCVVTESLPFQHTELTKIAKKTGYHLEKTDDFIQIFVS